MRKEVIIAIFAGFALGLIITVGINNAQKSLNKQKQQIQAEDTKDRTATSATSTHAVTVTTPLNYSILKDNEITISGVTTPFAFVAAISSEDEAIGTADENGNFALPFELATGANIVTVKSYTDKGEQTETLLEVVHSTADLTQTPDDAPADDEVTPEEENE